MLKCDFNKVAKLSVSIKLLLQCLKYTILPMKTPYISSNKELEIVFRNLEIILIIL